MSRRSRHASLLHLQMGQETIYLLLVGSLFLSVCLTFYVMELRGRETQPPILTLQEASGFSFPTGSAGIGEAFATKIRTEIIPRLKADAGEYDAYVIEVVGHTDEMPLQRSESSNLDISLLPWLNGRSHPVVRFGDNVGLGMARAVAVVRLLRQSGLGEPYIIIPMSAGPAVGPGDMVSDGRTAKDDQRRRRIELRLRRSDPAAVTTPNTNLH